MRITKLMSLPLALMISVLLSNAVKAQDSVDLLFKGIEISKGYQEQADVYGWMCYGKTMGALPGNFTVSMNYEGARLLNGNNSISGGSWTLPVYAMPQLFTVKPIRSDSYQGALFGSIEAGSVMWDKTGTIGIVEAKLVIAGGTQSLADRKGSGVLNGTVTYDEKGAGTFNGTISFLFQ